MRLIVGTSGFGYGEWKGTFYPRETAPGDMLRLYAGHFETVEVNNTFYRMPTAGLLESWAAQVPDGFVFAFKAPMVITHLKRLRNAGEETARLFDVLSILGRKLGPVLFQLPAAFRSDPPALEAFLSLLPDRAACAFEFRSPTWLEGDVPALLRARGCSLCVADTDERPAEGMIGTAPWGYVRLRRSGYSDSDLRRWAGEIRGQGWERAFVFVKHQGEGARGPATALRFLELAAGKRACASRASTGARPKRTRAGRGH